MFPPNSLPSLADSKTDIASQVPRRSRNHHRSCSRARGDDRRHVRIADHAKLRRDAVERDARCTGESLADNLRRLTRTGNRKDKRDEGTETHIQTEDVAALGAV